MGLERADDAGVYKISDEIALIQTVDFFTPIVDDAYGFGQIAAANALSDVYAMGGVPKTAMNLVGFPTQKLDISVLRRMLEGGADKMREAGVVLVGGHSVEDQELKYGLSVTGTIHPDKVLTKKNLKAGDKLVLTKPLGTGIINTAIKRKAASEAITQKVTALMAELNKKAAEVMDAYPVHACTDITGFGLLGHLSEMVVGSGCGIELQANTVPVLAETFKYAKMGMVPGGAIKNRSYRENMVEFDPSLEPSLQDIFFDPQTSGGLMICVDGQSAVELLNDLKENGVTEAAIVGTIVSQHRERIVIQ